MDKKCYFHFSLGPVQEFVGKARRLRDYWTGSYLLSYLSEQAMDEVCNRGGYIIFPPYKGNKNNFVNKINEIGSFPNRFQAKVPLDFKPMYCEKKIRDTWEKIANYVWEKYISPITSLGNNSKEIWDRQVKGFWYMQWVLSDEENDSLLDIRKNWRNYIPTIEAGDKCTLFGNLQEISGYVRASKKNQRIKQDQFWDTMMSKLPLLDLKEGERLCAVALIKRLFPRIYNEINKESNLPENFPSTTYMSAISWMKTVIKKDESLAVDFANEAVKLKRSSKEFKAGIKCLGKLADRNSNLKNFISLDGNCFYTHTLLNDNLWITKDKSIRKKLVNKLEKISEKVGFGADTYYALLSMDGDRMGAILQDNRDKKAEISKKISTFSESVPGIIENHNGRVIYAGGEDVFAILPVDTAIEAAINLNKKYTELFEPIFNSKDIATISAAIVFVHHHAPLNKVYEEIQSLLDDKAKDECGRASLAVCTWNTGGPDLVWAMPWRIFVDEDGQNMISKLSKSFTRNSAKEGITSSFIYNIRKNFELLGLVNGDNIESKQNWKVLLNKEEVLEVLVAEYMKSRLKSGASDNGKITKDKIKPLMENLLELCIPYYRDDDGKIKKREGFNMNGALLIRFLSRR